MLQRLKQTLKILTYRDMVDFSTMLAEKVGTDPETMADALLDLPGDTEDEQLEKTNQILTACFNRKKQITIQPEHHPAGGTIYKIACPSVDGAVVFREQHQRGSFAATRYANRIAGIQRWLEQKTNEFT